MTFQEWWKGREQRYGCVEDAGPRTAAHDAWSAAIAQEREAHRLTVKMAAELLDEVRAQWGQDYLWKKWGMDGQVAALITRMP